MLGGHGPHGMPPCQAPLLRRGQTQEVMRGQGGALVLQGGLDAHGATVTVACARLHPKHSQVGRAVS